MLRRHTILCSVLPLAVVGYLILVSSASAQSGIPSGAFIVKPAKVELELSPGESRTVEVTLTNGTPSPLSIQITKNDITSKTQGNAIDDPITISKGGGGAHSLKDLLSFPQSSLEILSYKEIRVPITVTMPKDVLPGGRYGGVSFEFSPAISDKEQPPQNIAVKSSIATLFFVRVKGEVHEDGALAAFGLFNNARTALSPTDASPLRFQVAFENKGDVQLNPHGTITLRSMWGSTNSFVIDPWIVLPGSTRMREIDYTFSLAPGYYKASLTQSRGYADAIDISEAGFWVVPSLPQMLVGLIILIILILLLRRSLSISRNTIS